MKKWARVIITGKKTSKKVAKEFIERTDRFWIYPDYTGNDHENIARYKENAGLVKLENFIAANENKLKEAGKPFQNYMARAYLEKKINHVSLNHFESNMANSCYINGPYSMINPDGTIYFNQNK